MIREAFCGEPHRALTSICCGLRVAQGPQPKREHSGNAQPQARQHLRQTNGHLLPRPAQHPQQTPEHTDMMHWAEEGFGRYAELAKLGSVRSSRIPNPYAAAQDVVIIPRYSGGEIGHPAPTAGGVMHILVCKLPRIHLLGTSVNNLFGECAGLGSLASSLLAGKGYGKDVL